MIFYSDITVHSKLTIGVDDIGHDVKFFGATAGSYMLWDESADALLLTDSTPLNIGDGSDLQIKHNGSDTLFNNNTGDMYFTNKANNKDIIFQSDDGNGGVETYFYLDGGDSTTNPMTVFPDNSFLCFGNNTTTQTGDFYIKHNGTNSFINNYTGDLTIKNAADDKDIKFQCDDGSGGTETYFFLDGSASSGSPFTVFPDSSQLAFGTGNDMLIYHDGTDNHIDAISALNIATGTSGVRVNIGHATSEVVLGDNLTVAGDIDVDGTTNLDAVDIDGNVDMAGTLLVAGLVTTNVGLTIKATGAPTPAEGYAVLYMDQNDGAVKIAVTYGEATTRCTICPTEGEGG